MALISASSQRAHSQHFFACLLSLLLLLLLLLSVCPIGLARRSSSSLSNLLCLFSHLCLGWSLPERPLRRVLEDGRIGDEGLVLVSGQRREARKDVEMVKVAVPLDENHSMRRWQALCQYGGGVHTAIAATDDYHVLRAGEVCGSRRRGRPR